jgi:hypothetical protein
MHEKDRVVTNKVNQMIEEATPRSQKLGEQMVEALRCQRSAELKGTFEPEMIRDAIADLAVKNILVEVGMEEWSDLEKLGYELLKQSAGIKC